MEIKVTTLNEIKLLMKKDTETCGIAEEDGDYIKGVYLRLAGIINSDQQEGRKSCQHLTYDYYIWHTHPLGSTPQDRKSITKFYPSREDLMKPRWEEKVMVSLIFTTAGIWEIFCDNNEYFPVDYDVILDEINNKLYKATKDGRIINYEEYRKYKQAIDTYILEVTTALSRSDVKDYQIALTPWREIQGPYTLKFL